MKFCNRCNYTYIDEFNYCPTCGSILSKYESKVEEREEKKTFSASSPDLGY